MSPDQLRTHLATLAELHDVTVSELRHAFGPDVDVMQCMGRDGRPVLADIVVALVNGHAALAHLAPRSWEHTVGPVETLTGPAMVTYEGLAEILGSADTITYGAMAIKARELANRTEETS